MKIINHNLRALFAAGFALALSLAMATPSQASVRHTPVAAAALRGNGDGGHETHGRGNGDGGHETHGRWDGSETHD